MACLSVRDVILTPGHYLWNLRLLAPWGVLGGGAFKSPEQLESGAQLRGGAKPTEEQLKLCKVLEEVAKEIGDNVHLANSMFSSDPLGIPGLRPHQYSCYGMG
jgi:hypothetical protein